MLITDISTTITTNEKSQLNIANKNIENLKINSTFQTDKHVMKILISIDGRNTWYTRIHDQWKECELTDIDSVGVPYDSLSSVLHYSDDFFINKKVLDLAMRFKTLDSTSNIMIQSIEV